MIWQVNPPRAWNPPGIGLPSWIVLPNFAAAWCIWFTLVFVSKPCVSLVKYLHLLRIFRFKQSSWNECLYINSCSIWLYHSVRLLFFQEQEVLGLLCSSACETLPICLCHNYIVVIAWVAKSSCLLLRQTRFCILLEPCPSKSNWTP